MKRGPNLIFVVTRIGLWNVIHPPSDALTNSIMEEPFLKARHSLFMADVLPEPLPSTDQIEMSSDILIDRGGAKVVGVGSHFVVKYGFGIDLEEGRTMMFVRQTTSVPVPRIYALFTDQGKNYIIMERIHGSTLQQIWSSIDGFEKRRIAAQIREHVNTLRQIHLTAFCSVGNKHLRDGIFWTADETISLGGPFHSESELHNAIVKNYKLSISEFVQRKAGYCERMLLSELRYHRPTFTHGDLQRKNIMITGATSASEITIFLIDWESSGFYPAYWEYSRAYGAVHFEDDWESYLCEILYPFTREYNMLSVVMNDLSC